MPLSFPAQPASSTSADRLAWFREAKYGLFIHWGLYAIPAGEWKGVPHRGIGEWIMHRAKIPAEEYARLAAQFNPTAFDADAWAQLAQDAGMKYVVFTAKHHDGFALFQSDVSEFDVADATPFRRDVVRELAEACARRGLRFGVYYSQAQDWHESNGAGNTWDFGPDEKKDFDLYLRTKAEPQVKELLTRYGPICLVWFDTPKLMTPERSQRMADLVRRLQPDCLIDGRLGTEGDYRSTQDNEVPNTVSVGAWETPATINHTWGFKKDDVDWKSPSQITFNLVDIVSKGGNYLLNVGPMADGMIPQPSQDTLRAVGDWLRTHGEAIYGAGPTPFGMELGEFSRETKDERGQPVFLARTDYRVTQKPGRLYFTFFRWPGESFVLPEISRKILAARLLGEPNRDSARIALRGDRTLVLLPQTPPHPMANVLAIDLGPDPAGP